MAGNEAESPARAATDNVLAPPTGDAIMRIALAPSACGRHQCQRQREGGGGACSATQLRHRRDGNEFAALRVVRLEADHSADTKSDGVRDDHRGVADIAWHHQGLCLCRGCLRQVLLRHRRGGVAICVQRRTQADQIWRGRRHMGGDLGQRHPDAVQRYGRTTQNRVGVREGATGDLERLPVQRHSTKAGWLKTPRKACLGAETCSQRKGKEAAAGKADLQRCAGSEPHRVQPDRRPDQARESAGAGASRQADGGAGGLDGDARRQSGDLVLQCEREDGLFVECARWRPIRGQAPSRHGINDGISRHAPPPGAPMAT